MKWFNSDRRREGGRDENNQIPVENNHREEERKITQRREFFRVVYPVNASPKITNLSARVVDISVHAVKFELPAESSFSQMDIDNAIGVIITFHDGHTINTSGKILKKNRLDDKCVFVCIFDVEISPEIINKEQSYLLKNFPDFCRKTFNFEASESSA
ncbi:MAG: hypothetical protein BWY69_00526 [Planctomycetes bacterium ADurb.Bin401]|nr:MAG: hypothetical protein BWY69_00526 [Planctomycetes bacterium ADurb.Bin401]